MKKRIKINGIWWKVGHKDNIGGEFDYKTNTINVNQKSNLAMDYLFHEIMEILMEEEKLRYSGQTDTNFRFFLDHDDFTRYSESLLQVILENKLFS